MLGQHICISEFVRSVKTPIAHLFGLPTLPLKNAGRVGQTVMPRWERVTVCLVFDKVSWATHNASPELGMLRLDGRQHGELEYAVAHIECVQSAWSDVLIVWRDVDCLLRANFYFAGELRRDRREGSVSRNSGAGDGWGSIRNNGVWRGA